MERCPHYFGDEMGPRPAPGAFPRSTEFSNNSENLSAILRTSTQLDRLHKLAIRRGSIPEVEAMAEVQYLYLGIEAEARLRKILSDPTGFSETDRDEIRKARSQIDRWLKAVDLSFGRHYGAWQSNGLDTDALPGDVRRKHESIRGMLNGELRPVIQNRNKIAHGQPFWQLKSGSDYEFKSTSSLIEYGDYWNLKYRRAALGAIGNVVLTLVVSLPTFERDYRLYVAAFDEATSKISDNSDGSEYRRFSAGLAKQSRHSESVRFSKMNE